MNQERQRNNQTGYRGVDPDTDAGEIVNRGTRKRYESAGVVAPMTLQCLSSTEHSTVNHDLKDSRSSSPGKESKDGETKIQRRDDVFLITQRKNATIFTDAKESTPVSEVKTIVEGILKVAPEDQNVFRDDQPLHDNQKLGDCGFTSASAKAQAAATLGLSSTEHSTVNHDLKDSSRSSSPGKESKDGETKIQRRDDVFLMTQRKNATIFTDAKESTPVSEVKTIVEGILKVAPEDQNVFRDDQHLHDNQKLGDCGFTSASAKAQAAATLGLSSTEHNTVNHDLKDSSRSSSPGKESKDGETKIQRRDDVFLMIRRKNATIFTDAKESTPVSEVKTIVEGILKVAPEDQKLFRDDQPLHDNQTLGDCGFTSASAKAQAPATIGLAFRQDDGDFERLEISALSNPPELPDVMKPQVFATCHSQEQTTS